MVESKLPGLDRLILEALDRVAAPDVRNRIVELALAHAQEHEVPRDPEDLAIFVRGSLREVVRAQLGEDAAEAVLEDATPILARAGVASGVHCKAAAAPAPALIVATDDAPCAHELQQQHAGVIWAKNLFTLVSQACLHETALIIIDCRMVSVSALFLSAAARRLPATTKVILWRWDSGGIEGASVPASWLRVAPEVPIRSLVWMGSDLVSRRRDAK